MSETQLDRLRLDNTRLERDCAALRAQVMVINHNVTVAHVENARLRDAILRIVVNYRDNTFLGDPGPELTIGPTKCGFAHIKLTSDDLNAADEWMLLRDIALNGPQIKEEE